VRNDLDVSSGLARTALSNRIWTGISRGRLARLGVLGVPGSVRYFRPVDLAGHLAGIADAGFAQVLLGQHGLEVGATTLYPILENAQAIRQAYEIATASDRDAYMGGAVSRFGDIGA
jgi:hypothetical protein